MLQTATAQKLSFLGRLICAGEKNRTPDYWLEASRFTTKLHPQLRIYVGYSSTFSIQAPISREKPTPNLLSPEERTVTWAVP